MGENWVDEGDLLGKNNNTITANSTFDMPTEDTSQKGLLASKSLSELREE